MQVLLQEWPKRNQHSHAHPSLSHLTMQAGEGREASSLWNSTFGLGHRVIMVKRAVATWMVVTVVTVVTVVVVFFFSSFFSFPFFPRFRLPSGRSPSFLTRCTALSTGLE